MHSDSSSSCERKVEDERVHRALKVIFENIGSGSGGSGLG